MAMATGPQIPCMAGACHCVVESLEPLESLPDFDEISVHLAFFTLHSIVGHLWHRVVLPFQARRSCTQLDFDVGA